MPGTSTPIKGRPLPEAPTVLPVLFQLVPRSFHEPRPTGLTRLMLLGSLIAILMLLGSLIAGLRGQAALQAENIALRHQLTVLQRTQPTKRPVLKPADRYLWVWLSRLWSEWRSTLIIVLPETVIGWHRQGFRWYWTWKVRHGKSGRPQVPKETRDLIRTMSRDNPLWGAPRIHSELMKLGIKISEASVANTWSDVANHHRRRGERFSTITSRNSLPSTFSLSTRFGLKYCSSLSSSSTIDDASST